MRLKIRYHIGQPEYTTPESPVYSLIRPLLFSMDAERAHDCTIAALRTLGHVPGAAPLLRASLGGSVPSLPVTALGLKFPNPVGLAAGLDKDARCPDAFHAMGFGFVELGTVTPRPQSGNARPRLFRIPNHEAIINRMGFNSGGLSAFLKNLRSGARSGIVGINLGKNRDTPVELAVDDYLTGLREVYDFADYVTVNISSPNTPGLRDLQNEDELGLLVKALMAERNRLAAASGRQIPLAVKIAPDLDHDAIDAIARILITNRVDAVIATNTTVSREGLAHEAIAAEAGGLSGPPLRDLSTKAIHRLYRTLRGQVAIIGVGGIFTADHAWEKLVAGADLVQIYSALIYRGPRVVGDIIRGLLKRVRSGGFESLSEAVAHARQVTGHPHS